MAETGGPQVPWHIFSRGTRRLQLFRDDEDYDQFVIFLQYSLKVTGAVLWAFALMSNHYHLVLHATADQRVACMRRLNRLYSGYHNKKYGLSGHAFDWSYRFYEQRSMLLLMQCVAYVFYNPVKAGLSEGPDDYPWSCFKDFIGVPGSALRVSPNLLMEYVHQDPKIAWDMFHRALEREARRPAKKRPGASTMTEVHVQQFECLLDHARTLSIAEAGVTPELLAMHWGRKVGISPRAMAEVLGNLTPGAVSSRLRRLAERLKADPEFAARIPPLP